MNWHRFRAGFYHGVHLLYAKYRFTCKDPPDPALDEARLAFMNKWLTGTPLFYKHLPPQLQKRIVALELLPLGLSLKDLPLVYGNREAFEQLCKLPYAGIRHYPTESTRLSKDFIYGNLALLMDIVYIDFSVLRNAPLAISQNRDTMIEICKRNPECILIACDPRNGRMMRLGLDSILEIMEGGGH